jgi:hypothetical protein
MNHRYGYISGSAKHHHKIHVLVELGPQCELPDEHSGGEYEVHWAVTACGIDTRTKSGRKWRALVLNIARGYNSDITYCMHCVRKINKEK